MLKLIGETPLPTDLGGWTYMVFRDSADGRQHTMMVYRKPSDIKAHPNGVLVRVHSSCATSELFHANNCECREELDEAMRRIRREGRGVLVYLDQEGAGNGIEAKIKAYAKAFRWDGGNVVPAKDQKTGADLSIYSAYEKLGYKKEQRSYDAPAAMLKYIGVKSVRLLTNNPSKIEGLEKAGIPTKAVNIHISPKNKIVAEHLAAKAQQLGHNINGRHLKVK